MYIEAISLPSRFPLLLINSQSLTLPLLQPLSIDGKIGVIQDVYFQCIYICSGCWLGCSLENKSTEILSKALYMPLVFVFPQL